MLTTTYKHDFIQPKNKRYDFVKENVNKSQVNSECNCENITSVDKEQSINDSHGTVEWTGIAPMGRLIDPRIIPTKISPDQADAIANARENDCNKIQPNRFLKILRTVYPDLYERLQQMPQDELNRRMEQQRMYTTYQIDFCNVNEYPEGIYKSLKEEDETSKLNASKLLKKDEPCNEFRRNVMEELNKQGGNFDPCIKAYKPFKISFADSNRFINSGNNSHWRSGEVFKKNANFTEYMDTINKIGCVIMKNNLHDHRKCSGKHCRHQLVHTCTQNM
ncbi:uncharacterized protein LOC133337854 [Musca vetustissima]|uniref:uncharacterized protein LOC133337854 n=1 Tax=Musca vetustissima TaxID=27455 RepID=UPI002AB60F98|nr:uncharacterized protein LOC133337854 [Musca vetustissima]